MGGRVVDFRANTHPGNLVIAHGLAPNVRHYQRKRTGRRLRQSTRPAHARRLPNRNCT